ncbi:putative mitochondrial calcium uniporter protein, mitochondrial [Leptomonas pyrrhocoris]|uniref:Putative mitochondrial calcium uniporter protein, mitochondrial n=1 Tax=Leptomonas pyrrhocoris TaxID=157538 RepID=A0A0M9G2A0_LEPPY|nr:putative mitochondrial calcium uniporter protein, mitochondrial [Leptomonas pyrrhocoris]KPA80885.1 putative mitochondrial calcium uniporter protein, mitochondrial [Leptomonas pyrrhocoris]|eukprot:XP_015659324.1 putative mitochondrial calcium uniporter protein, mitochondrial [Leptomonas pyrrhocoris]
MRHTSFSRLLRPTPPHVQRRRVAWGSSNTRSSVYAAPLCTACRLLGTSRTAFATASTAAALSAADFATIAPQLLLRQALQQYAELDGTQLGAELHPGEGHVLIPRERFLRFCAQAHVDDPDAALADLEAAGVVVALDGGTLIHLRPVLYLETVELLSQTQNGTDGSSGSSDGTPVPSTGSSVGAFMLEEAERRIEKLCQKEQELAEQLRPAIARAAKWRRSVWGGALLFAGTQLAVISRLTYFDLDWDIMEPVSYCITIGTALVFYAYYLRYNEEHTYEVFDQRFLPKKVRQYAPKDFDWKAYEGVCAQLVEERAMRERLRRWAERH